MNCKAVMRVCTLAMVFAVAGITAAVPAAAVKRAAAGTSEIDIAPPSGRGRVVLVISGVEGPALVKPYAEKIARLGYDTVIVDGRHIAPDDSHGGLRLRQAIATAEGSPHALPGKVAVIGFAVGGAAALAHAEQQPDSVSLIIAYYPATSFIGKPAEMKAFVEKFKVPLVVFAAAKDNFKDCCRVKTVTAMDATANELGKPMELIVYSKAEHNFIAGSHYRAIDADNAWRRTKTALQRYLGAPPAH